MDKLTMPFGLHEVLEESNIVTAAKELEQCLCVVPEDIAVVVDCLRIGMAWYRLQGKPLYRPTAETLERWCEKGEEYMESWGEGFQPFIPKESIQWSSIEWNTFQAEGTCWWLPQRET